MSHVGKKIFERFPSFANGDSSAAIIFKVGDIPVIATISHVVPSMIFSAPFPGSAEPVGCGPRENLFSVKASATPSIPARKISQRDGCFFPAITETSPIAFATADARQGSQPAKSLAGNIVGFSHGEF